MTDWAIHLDATVPEQHVADTFKTEVLKTAALYGVQVRELEVKPDRKLRLVPPPKDAA